MGRIFLMVAPVKTSRTSEVLLGSHTYGTHAHTKANVFHFDNVQVNRPIEI